MTALGSASEATLAWARARAVTVQFNAETGSTNDDAKGEAFTTDAALSVHVTDHQTAGRGRGANHWLDTGAGEVLLSTWSHALRASPRAVTAPRIGLALFTAASRTWPSLAWGLKAPNDLYLDGLKIAGLLVETLSAGGEFRLVIGLGFNVLNHPRRFGTATHLGSALGRAPDEDEWFKFLDEWVAQMHLALSDVVKPLLDPAVRQDLRRALNANSARTVTVTDVTSEGDLIHAAGVIRWTEL